MHGCIHESLIISCNRYGYTCAVNIDTTESSRGANACSGPFFFACSFKLLLPEDILERILRQTFKNTDPFDDVIMFITSLFIPSNATPLDFEASAIFFFCSLSSCLDTKWCWWCSWLIRLIRVGMGWYLNNHWYNTKHNFNYFRRPGGVYAPPLPPQLAFLKNI